MNGTDQVLSVFLYQAGYDKFAPVVAELSGIREKICSVTVGLVHRDMMDQVLAVLGIARHDPGSCKTTSLLTLQSEACVDSEEVLLRESLTCSWRHFHSLCQGVSLFYCRTEVGHVEAGLHGP